MTQQQHIAIVGAGWAGLAAAVYATQAGHHVNVFEAAPQWGGRARTATLPWPDGAGGTRPLALDNGQHILIGAYSACFALMRLLGQDPLQAFARLPLTLRFADGQGLALPDWPSPLDAGWGILRAKGWRWGDKLSLLRTAGRWQRMGFRCAPEHSVAQLCQGLSPTLMDEFIDPLCVSALNTPASEASGQVFLNVLRDSLLGERVGELGASNLMLPRQAMGALWCDAAAQWLRERGVQLHLGQAVQQLHPIDPHTVTTPAGMPSRTSGPAWQVNGMVFDAVILATNAAPAARLVHGALGSPAGSRQPPLSASDAASAQAWANTAGALRYEAITTVYAQVDAAHAAKHGIYHLSLPMLALRATAQHPAQFVFERDQLHPCSPHERSHALAFVLSASRLEREALTHAVRAQALAELGLPVTVHHVLSDKRATFCCTPDLQRPGTHIAPNLLACGDYIDGPYPATLEGAVRSAQDAVATLGR